MTEWEVTIHCIHCGGNEADWWHKLDKSDILHCTYEAVRVKKAVQTDQLVYVTVHRNNGRLPSYHFDKTCNLQPRSRRIPTMESEARKVGLQVCKNCHARVKGWVVKETNNG